jgi:hypothetical protein
MMNDYQETRETKEVKPPADNSEEIGRKGMDSMRGVTGEINDAPAAKPPERPEPPIPPPVNEPVPDQPADNKDDPITIHPKKGFEYLPDVEKEPISNEGKIQPPPGWQPGGPERGG